MCTESGLKGGGPSPESQTNLHFHNYICIYIMATESWSVISDPGSLLLSFWFFTASWEKKEKKTLSSLSHGMYFQGTIKQESCNECQKHCHQIFWNMASEDPFNEIRR